MSDNPICLVLDTPDVATLERLVDQTHEYVGMYKVGLTALYGVGIEYVTEKQWPHPLFLDAKLLDIPQQVAGAVEGIREIGADLVTVHALGGSQMLRSAVKAADGRIGVLAVTVLTSLDAGDLTELGWREDPRSVVERLARLAIEAGVDGLVSSPLEVALLRERFGPRDAGGPLLVTPGIRPNGADPGDQRRTMPAADALKAGADILVVGRSITSADDPGRAAKSLLEELRG